MKHIINWAKIVPLEFLSLIVQVIGIFMVPIGLLFLHQLPADSSGYINHRMPRLFWAWDNYGSDGTDGDINYRNDYAGKINFYTRFNWLAIRNRAYNFNHFIGVHHEILSLTGHGSKWHEIGYGYWEAVSYSGRIFPEYYLGIAYFKSKRHPGYFRGMLISLGWKNFNVNLLPKRYNYSFAFDIQPYRLLRRRDD